MKNFFLFYFQKVNKSMKRKLTVFQVFSSTLYFVYSFFVRCFEDDYVRKFAFNELALISSIENNKTS